jgi:glyoxylase-like metal-dependent hydrolase (beta-lactamase superfamily II)
LLAVIALVFSFGTTAVSYVRTAQLDSHDRRVELQLSTLEPQVATFGDGATLDVPGSPRVILVPGHTPGSAALHVSARGTLFAGDTLATLNVVNGHTGPQIAPFGSDQALALASLSRLEGIDAQLVLPGHGLPWTGGVPAAIAAVREAESHTRW